jgi:hypothetical protein
MDISRNQKSREARCNIKGKSPEAHRLAAVWWALARLVVISLNHTNILDHPQDLLSISRITSRTITTAHHIISPGFSPSQTTRPSYANFLKETISATKETCVIMLTGRMNFNNQQMFQILTRWPMELQLVCMAGILNNSRCLILISMLCSSRKWWWWSRKFSGNGSNKPNISSLLR